jgi:hypothetical protein
MEDKQNHIDNQKVAWCLGRPEAHASGRGNAEKHKT